MQYTRSIHQSPPPRQARVPNPAIDQTTVRRQVEICEKSPCFARAGLEEESTEAFPVHLIDAGCSTMREKKKEKKKGHAAATRLKVDLSEAIVRRPFTPFPDLPSRDEYRANLPGQTVNVRLPSMDGPPSVEEKSSLLWPRLTLANAKGRV